jgi:hypothetical protein
MGRISEKHLRYRSREQMSADAAIALRSAMSHGGKHSVLQVIMWAWTEFHGKYVGCPYWTPGAIAEQAADPRLLAKRLRHEHAVPRRVVIEGLFALGQPDQERVHAYLTATLFGVVVTRGEDRLLDTPYRRTMPPEFHDPASPGYRDPWLRYRRCGMTVLDRTRDDAWLWGRCRHEPPGTRGPMRVL